MDYSDSTIAVSATCGRAGLQACVKMPNKWAFSPGAARIHQLWNCSKDTKAGIRTRRQAKKGLQKQLQARAECKAVFENSEQRYPNDSFKFRVSRKTED